MSDPRIPGSYQPNDPVTLSRLGRNREANEALDRQAAARGNKEIQDKLSTADQLSKNLKNLASTSRSKWGIREDGDFEKIAGLDDQQYQRTLIHNIGGSTKDESEVLLDLFYKYPDIFGNRRSAGSSKMFSIYSEKTLDTPYGNFFQLKQDSRANIEAIISKFNANRNANALLNMETEQTSKLFPYIRLFKTVTGQSNNPEKHTYVEFPFSNQAFFYEGLAIDRSNDPDFRDIFSDRRMRGADVGLTSVKWAFEGTDPITANKFIKLEVNIFFSNINGLTIQRQTGGAGSKQTFRYSDLISRERDVLKQHKIHAQLGWSVPTVFDDITDPLKEAIYSSRVSLDLNLLAHEFSFNDDGSCDLRIEYQSSIFVNDNSGASNLLTPNLKDGLKEFGWNDEKDRARSALRRTIERQKKGALGTANDEQKEQLKNLDEQYNIVKAGLASKAVSLLIDNIVKKGSVKSVLLPRELFWNEFGLWEFVCPDLKYSGNKEWSGEKASTYVPQISKQLLSALASSTVSYNSEGVSVNRAVQQLKARSVPKSVRGKDRSVPDLNRDDLGSQGAALKFADGNNKEVLKKLADAGFSGFVVLMHYCHIGDLIDAACEILKTNGLKRGDVGFPNMVFGHVPIFDPCEAARRSRKPQQKATSILNLPVDIETAFVFLDKNIVGKDLKNYTILDFVHDIFTKLVPEMYRGFSKTLTNSLRFIPKIEIAHAKRGAGVLGSKDPLSKASPQNGRPLTFDLSRAEEITGISSNQNFMNGKVTPSYTFILCRLEILANDYLFGSDKPNYAKDYNNGVYWLSLASQEGIVKTWSFAKVDAPYLAESRINDKGELGRDISGGNLYNLTVDMVGNNLFKPGSIVFIDPRGLGFDAALAKDLYVGGYYTVVKVNHEINDGGYTTSVELVFLRQAFASRGASNVIDLALAKNSNTKSTTPTGPKVNVTNGNVETTRVAVLSAAENGWGNAETNEVKDAVTGRTKITDSALKSAKEWREAARKAKNEETREFFEDMARLEEREFKGRLSQGD